MVIILTLIIFTIGAIVAAAVIDFLQLKIPNLIPVVVALAFGVTWGAQIMTDNVVFDEDIKGHLISGGLMFTIMLTLFFLGLFGGGDAKLIPAIALWVGINGLPVFLLITTITGGILAVLSIGLRKTNIGKRILTLTIRNENLKTGWCGAMARGENVVPYGIAIAIGALWSFAHIGLLP